MATRSIRRWPGEQERRRAGRVDVAQATRAPEPPSGPRPPPQLRVIDGGRRAGNENQRDGRKSQGGEP